MAGWNGRKRPSPQLPALMNSVGTGYGGTSTSVIYKLPIVLELQPRRCLCYADEIEFPLLVGSSPVVVPLLDWEPILCRAAVHVEHLPGGSALDLRKAGVGWYNEPLLIVPAPVFAVLLDQHPVAGCAARNIQQFARCQVDELHIAVAGRCDDPLLVPWRRASRVPRLWRPERRSGHVMAQCHLA